MPRQLRVFLCHASQDKPAVRKMHAYLKQHGIQPWLDREDLLPGQVWEVEIPRAINRSDVILVCLSKNSVNKEGFVQKEITFALDKALEKPEGTIFIIPVKLEECDVPPRLSRYQWLDYFRVDGRKRLLASLSLRAMELGDEISPVVMEDTRRAKPVTPPLVTTVIEKPQAEEAEREAKEKAERERLANEAKEKTKRERIERERLERQAAENAERLRLAREAKEKQEREKVVKQKADAPAAKPVDTAEKDKLPAPKLFLRGFGIGGVVFVCLLFAIFGGNYLIKNLPSAGTETPITAIPTNSKTKTPSPTRTQLATPAPPTFPPTPGIGLTMTSEKDGMVLVYIPEGEFTMGSIIYSDEQPIHQVVLDAFWIDQTEVTNFMYAKCVEDGDCESPVSTRSYSRENYYRNPEFANYPVLYVDWNGANAYCSWAGRELPTEAEWEKAARGTDGRTFPWGEDISCDKANYRGCIGDTSKVGSYPDGTSIYGALDMAGNVWEWVNSLFQDYPYSMTDGREDLSASGSRVLRGGSWLNYSSYVRLAYRNRSVPANAGNYIGFRCSLSP